MPIDITAGGRAAIDGAWLRRDVSGIRWRHVLPPEIGHEAFKWFVDGQRSPKPSDGPNIRSAESLLPMSSGDVDAMIDPCSCASTRKLLHFSFEHGNDARRGPSSRRNDEDWSARSPDSRRSRLFRHKRNRSDRSTGSIGALHHRFAPRSRVQRLFDQA